MVLTRSRCESYNGMWWCTAELCYLRLYIKTQDSQIKILQDAVEKQELVERPIRSRSER